MQVEPIGGRGGVAGELAQLAGVQAAAFVDDGGGPADHRARFAEPEILDLLAAGGDSPKVRAVVAADRAPLVVLAVRQGGRRAGCTRWGTGRWWCRRSRLRSPLSPRTRTFSTDAEPCVTGTVS